MLLAVLQLGVLPWADMRSREYAEILKQKQNLSLVEEGVFRELGKKNGRVYFVEQFDAEKGEMKNLFIREVDDKNRDSVVFAKSGNFRLDNNRRTLVLDQGYRYSGTAGKGDFDRVSFEHMELVISTVPKLNNSERHRHAVPTLELISSDKHELQAELMWRISLPLTVLVLSLLAVPLSYSNIRSGNSYHVLLAVVFFLIYQNGLTLLRDAVEDGKIPFWLGLLPMHILMTACALLLLRIRSMPARPFWAALKAALPGSRR